MKIAHIVGNRPQFIKLALLSGAIRQTPPAGELIIHTGQHFDHNMSGAFFEQLPLPKPDFTLNINNLSHGVMLGKMLEALTPLLMEQKPSVVVVYGDTNTTLAGALAAKKAGIPIAHVEAGIRTYDEHMPEETNRYLADRMADLNFACTYLGMDNLEKEGFSSGGINSRVFNTGDLMLDAAMRFKISALQQSTIAASLGVSGKAFVLATIHRAENTGNTNKLRQLATAINTIHQQVPVVFPVHPNTRKVISEHNISFDCIMTEPLGYHDTLALVQQAQSVVTDSGGLSREAFFFSKPTVVVMDKPFWPELFLYGPCLRSGAGEVLEKWATCLSLSKSSDVAIFGDGQAAGKISTALLQSFQ